MEDSVGLKVGHRLEILSASDIGFQQSDPASRHNLLKVFTSSEPAVVDHHYARAGIRHQVDQMRPDEARPASDQYTFH